jgi:hypothetical protein
VTDLREAMRAAATRRDLVAIDVPEWGRKVFLRKMSVRDSLDRDDGADPKMAAIRLLLDSVCDENGDPELSEGDLELILDQPVGVLMPILTEAARLNGFTSKELEDAVQSFGNAQS